MNKNAENEDYTQYFDLHTNLFIDTTPKHTET